MKIKISKQIKAAVVIVSLLLQMIPVFQFSATAAGVPGEMADFELKIDGIGSNIVNTIVYRPGYPNGNIGSELLENALNIPINIYFQNEKQYITGGGTAECDEYAWTAKASSSKVVSTQYVPKDGENISNKDVTDLNNDPTAYASQRYYLVITPKMIGTSVITVTAYIGDSDEAIKKTFTLRVVDASKHGTAEPTFTKDGNAFIPSANNHLQIPLNGKTVNFAIDKLLGYDYTTLSGSSYEKSIVNYKWTATLGVHTPLLPSPLPETDANDVLTLNSDATIQTTGTATQTIKSGAGSKSIPITPLREGTVTLTFVFEPTDLTVQAVFKPEIICTVVIDVVRYASSVDCTVEVKPDVHIPSTLSQFSATSALAESIVPINNSTTGSYLDIFLADGESMTDTVENTDESGESSSSADINSFSNPIVPDGFIEPEIFSTTEPDVTMTLKDFKSMWQSTPTTVSSDFASLNNAPSANDNIEEIAEIIGYSISYPSTATKEGSSGSTVKSWSKSNPNSILTKDNYVQVTIESDPDNNDSPSLKIAFNKIFENINTEKTFDVTITVTTRICKRAVDKNDLTTILYYYYDYTKTTKKVATVYFITNNDNGKIASIKVSNHGDETNTLNPPTEIFNEISENSVTNTVYGYVGTNSEKPSDKLKLKVTIDELRYFVIPTNDDEEDEPYIAPVFNFTSEVYTFTAISNDTDKVGIDGSVEIIADTPTLTLIPKAKGSSKISITVTKTTGSDIKTYNFDFTVNVLEMGVRPEDEGKIASVELKSPTKGKIVDGTRIYLAPQDKLDINISSVLEFSAKAKAPNYTQEATEYKWSVNIVNDQDKINNDGTNIIALNDPVEYGETADSKDRKSLTFTALDIPYNYEAENDRVDIIITINPSNSDFSDSNSFAAAGIRGKSQIKITIIVNELGGIFRPEIDYENEVVRIQTNKRGDDYTHYTYNKDKGPEYMYCLKAVSDTASQASEKWYPLMDDEIDVSTLIPKSGTSPYRLGIRLINEAEGDALEYNTGNTSNIDFSVKDANGNYSADYRRVALLAPRKTLTSAQKKDVYFDGTQIRLKDSSTLASGNETVNIYYQIGMSSFIGASISKTNGIKIDSTVAPLGGTVQVKIAGITDDDTSSFATAPIKVKIPAANKKPKIKYNEKKKSYTGFSAKLEWCTNVEDLNDPNKWTKITDKKFKAVPDGDFVKTFGNITPDSDGNCIIYVRTQATYKKNGVLSKPESEPIMLKIPASRYSGAVSGE